MSSSSVCQRCGCAEIDEDPAQGNAVCTNCGLVLEESKIVSEISFQETGSGGHALIGQFVSSDGPQRAGIGGPQGNIYKLRHMFSGETEGYVVKESREVTLNNGKRRIQEVASQLRMNQHCIDTGFNFFKMAVARGLTRGRRSTHVVAACLYLSARVNNTPHMLLDFSDVLQVCELALRLVKRMKRDWISFGRRPTGVCGAALLLAARYHNFHRTIADIVRVVNVGEGALRKRLEEFSVTPSGALTLDDFLSVDLESAQDPPSFQEARFIKVKKQQKRHELESKAESMQVNLLEMEKEIEDAIEAAKTANPKGSSII